MSVEDYFFVPNANQTQQKNSQPKNPTKRPEVVELHSFGGGWVELPFRDWKAGTLDVEPVVTRFTTVRGTQPPTATSPAVGFLGKGVFFLKKISRRFLGQNMTLCNICWCWWCCLAKVVFSLTALVIDVVGKISKRHPAECLQRSWSLLHCYQSLDKKRFSKE